MSTLCVCPSGIIACVRDGSLTSASAGLPGIVITQGGVNCIATDSAGGIAVAQSEELLVFSDAVKLFRGVADDVRWRSPVAIRVFAACFGPGWLACATEQTVQVFEANTGVLIAALSLSSRSRVLRLFSHLDGAVLVCIQEDSTIVVWDTATWTRACSSSGILSFARTVSAGFGCSVTSEGILVLAFADSRLAAASITRARAGVDRSTPALCSMFAVRCGASIAGSALLANATPLYSSSTHASSHLPETLSSLECAVGVEVLHCERISSLHHVDSCPDDPVALVAILTQRRLMIAGVSSSSDLHAISVVSLEVLADGPLLARAFCFSPPAAALLQASSWCQLIVEPLLGGSLSFIEIEPVLQATIKLAAGSCRPSLDAALRISEPSSCSSVPAPVELSVEECGHDGARNAVELSDVVDLIEGGNDDATTLTVVSRAPDALSFLLTASAPQLFPAAPVMSFETQRKVSLKSGQRSSSGTAPVTFHSKIRSSGYGAVPPRKPAWAVARPAAASTPRASVASRGGSSIAARASAYPLGTSPAVLDDAVLPPLTVGASRGTSGGTPASRSLVQSQAAFPCGPVASLLYNHDGSFFAVASHAGSVHTSEVHVRGTAGSSSIEMLASDIECHNVGTAAPVLCLSWSHTKFEGVARLLRHPPSGSSSRAPSVARAPESAQSSDMIAGLDGVAADTPQARAIARSAAAAARSAGERACGANQLEIAPAG
jgi:hypothetical protein